MAADRVTLGAREVVSVPLSVDFTLPETSRVEDSNVPTIYIFCLVELFHDICFSYPRVEDKIALKRFQTHL